MANFGRFVCVLVPFALTIGSLIALLVAGLAGVTDKSLYMFQANLTNLGISPSAVNSILHSRQATTFHDVGGIISGVTGTQSSGAGSGNITAADLGLYNLYDVGLWGYCYTPQNGSRACTKPAFNWAENVLNTTTGNINSMITASGQNVTLPKAITDAVTAFGTVSRWTQIVFIIAYVALAVELLFGIFANCSRAFSCVTFIVAAVAAVAVCGAAALATATSVVVVGAIEGTAKFYGVTGSFNNRYLAAVWIAALFALAAGFFWMFTICCCAPDHSRRSSRRSRGEDGEKLLHGPYQPIGDPNGFQNNNRFSQPYAGTPSYAQPQRDLAYEPYSHARS
ncbi:SUR7 family protein pun1 [Echria macrotheca]|uniref:SUR7 family protein pun1 n=1 Tax=Echria macrotheca TaxID=438768 RepID=A0AAJ0BB56_9PEZI|nr:SUR7 family protein pun1 [Echria macrotheca]